MKRIDSLTSQWRSKMGGQEHSTAVLLGDQFASIISDGYVCTQLPGVGWRHSSGQILSPSDQSGSLVSFHPYVQTTSLIERGVISDFEAAGNLVDALLSSLPQQPSWSVRHQAWYALPVKLTTLEKKIFERVFGDRVGVNWQPLSHSKIYQKLLETDFSDLGQLAILAINSQTTDLVLWSDYQAEKPLVAESLYWGTKDLERLIQARVRDLYQVQLSSAGLESLMGQLSDDLFDESAQLSGSVSIRAQALNSGRPTTVNVPIAELAIPAREWLSYLWAGLKVILHRRDLTTTAPIFERGLVVVGQGARLADLVPVIGNLLGTSTTSVSEPQDWLIKGLKILTKRSR